MRSIAVAIFVYFSFILYIFLEFQHKKNSRANAPSHRSGKIFITILFLRKPLAKPCCSRHAEPFEIVDCQEVTQFLFLLFIRLFGSKYLVRVLSVKERTDYHNHRKNDKEEKNRALKFAVCLCCHIRRIAM